MWAITLLCEMVRMSHICLIASFMHISVVPYISGDVVRLVLMCLTVISSHNQFHGTLVDHLYDTVNYQQYLYGVEMLFMWHATEHYLINRRRCPALYRCFLHLIVVFLALWIPILLIALYFTIYSILCDISDVMRLQIENNAANVKFPMGVLSKAKSLSKAPAEKVVINRTPSLCRDRNSTDSRSSPRYWTRSVATEQRSKYAS